jgi:hypothetical protein
VVILVLAMTGLVPARSQLLLPTLLLALLSVCALFILFGSKESYQARQAYFYLVVLTCLVLGGGWLASALIK